MLALDEYRRTGSGDGVPAASLGDRPPYRCQSSGSAACDGDFDERGGHGG